MRHFLACCSQDARGQETTVEILIEDEKFKASGLMILARNYLDVYTYESWSDKVDSETNARVKNLHSFTACCVYILQTIPAYAEGDRFEPSNIDLVRGETHPPQLLSEADLIALMDKHGNRVIMTSFCKFVVIVS